MKIGIVYPYFAHYRGAILEEMLKCEKNKFVFLAGTKLPKGLNSIKLHEFKKEDRFIELKNLWITHYFLYQTNLMKTIKNEKFDCLVFLGDWKYLCHWKVFLYANRNNIPCMFWSHGVLRDSKDINGILKWKYFSSFNSGGFLYSNYAKSLMEKMGYKKELRVIYNSLDFERQKLYFKKSKDVDSELDIPLFNNEYPYLVFSGRLLDSRKIDVLLKAVKNLSDNQMCINVLVVGNGPSEEALKKLVSSLGLVDQVNFFGACYEEEILATLFKNSLCCVFPGPIGLTLIHAMTYGTIVITNNNMKKHKPEIEALIADKTGFLFEEDNHISLSNSIERVIELDEKTRKEMQESSIKVIEEKYNAKVQLEIMNKRFSELELGKY